MRYADLVDLVLDTPDLKRSLDQLLVSHPRAVNLVTRDWHLLIDAMDPFRFGESRTIKHYDIEYVEGTSRSFAVVGYFKSLEKEIHCVERCPPLERLAEKVLDEHDGPFDFCRPSRNFKFFYEYCRCGLGSLCMNATELLDARYDPDRFPAILLLSLDCRLRFRINGVNMGRFGGVCKYKIVFSDSATTTIIGKKKKKTCANATTTMTCVICMDEDRSVAIQPCGHCVCCAGCSKKIESCPICRKDVRSLITVYF
ncbi:zinc c3hc4 type ring finger domain containing protein [Lasius niger]|uniref:Zinc c3hc4 type ring finger domain containing protein n=1 Tax=Lasius niger TaxID=67767 RepID=A0A0J7JW57_LASNI|nr:zinc c3hc4 type ring finger domain containing protein [Lasius niger]